jgi:hypothetical protein
VPVTLSPRDRELILEHAMLHQRTAETLRQTSREARAVSFGFTIDELEELLGYFAVEANHCGDRRLQRELDGLYHRLKAVEESFDDGRRGGDDD